MPVVYGKVMDVVHRRQFPGRIVVEGSRIVSVEADAAGADAPYVLPGFVDAHVHVESSMLLPAAFARQAVVHGTVASVSDPHEIANVLGLDGVHFMLDDAAQCPFHFCFGAPSCVPATPFETAGASLDSTQVASLLQNPAIGYLSEVMNFPGVLNGDAEVMSKIAAAVAVDKPVDGHAPGLSGQQAVEYIYAANLLGNRPVITTDHECVAYDEALWKLQHGMSIIIREGSAAKNFDALLPLLSHYPQRIMFCSDDKHPDDLLHGHINQLVARAVAAGFPLWDVLQAACINPVRHYRLSCGLLQPGDSADFILVNNLTDFKPVATFLRGHKVAEAGQPLLPPFNGTAPNRFSCTPKQPSDFQVPCQGKRIRVIEVVEGQLITRSRTTDVLCREGCAVSDPEKDVLKLTVVNRYADAPPALAFVSGFGLRQAALASSVAHDSHNIVAVGTDDDLLCRAVNAIIAQRGGLAAVTPDTQGVLPLPVAGLMTTGTCSEVAAQYETLNRLASSSGCRLKAPFMTLSFLALLVIPELKLSDRGLFDGRAFTFTGLFLD
ncbi:MAG: adenine deaminase [Chitinophagales bacterium]|nr:adenine deaminase [Chitinophagales bacterium]MDW8392714.1 adenine deaminase [Chitinophagales bacterium]